MKKIFFIDILLLVLFTFVINNTFCAATSTLDEAASSVSTFDFISQLVIPLTIEFVGAFLAFLSAIRLEYRMSRRKYSNVRQGLIKELVTISKDLEETYDIKRIDESIEINRAATFVYYYSTPKWDILMASGELSSILDDSSVNFLEIYTDIFKARKLEEEYLISIRSFDSNDDEVQIYNSMINQKKIEMALDIYKKINKIV